jgi:putative transposase
MDRHRTARVHRLIFGEVHLRGCLGTYVRHYNGHRPHWALGQVPPDADPTTDLPIAPVAGDHVRRAPVLGGLINEYHQRMNP